MNNLLVEQQKEAHGQFVWLNSTTTITESTHLRSPKTMAVAASSSSTMAQAMFTPRSATTPVHLRSSSSLPNLHLQPRSSYSPFTPSSNLQISGKTIHFATFNHKLYNHHFK